MAKIPKTLNVGDRKNLTLEKLLEIIEDSHGKLADAINRKPDVYDRSVDGATSETFLSNGDISLNSSTNKVEMLTSRSPTSVTWTDISDQYVPPAYSSLIQKVYVSDNSNFSTAAAIPGDDTIPQSSEGAELFTLDITPTDANSYLYFDIDMTIWSTLGNSLATAALFQDSGTSAIAACGVWNQNQAGFFPEALSFKYRMLAGTTDTITFKVRVGSSLGTTYVNSSSTSRFLGGSMAATMIITEVGN